MQACLRTPGERCGVEKRLRIYQERAPRNAVYDKYAKRYVATDMFKPIFLKPDPDGYLSRLRSLSEGLAERSESWIAQPPDADIAVTPRRAVDPPVLKAVLTAVREKRSVEVYYQSLSKERPKPIWRRMTPHAFGYDGFRWHVRAFCHLDRSFNDFLLPRILGARDMGDSGPGAEHDVLWQETFDVEIGPHPELTESQKAVVAKDYGMVGGRAVLRVRYAMLFYVLKRLGLLGNAVKQNPRTQHIVALNAKETARALKRAETESQQPLPSARRVS
ncbi:MAG TPA: WYL domain-containing protein [Xanthobacteraceae bacterium]|jgi:hypothetical protein|nr:WYL domain-containing protein [Xanthobacteraceae bacterium]